MPLDRVLRDAESTGVERSTVEMCSGDDTVCVTMWTQRRSVVSRFASSGNAEDQRGGVLVLVNEVA